MATTTMTMTRRATRTWRRCSPTLLLLLMTRPFDDKRVSSELD